MKKLLAAILLLLYFTVNTGFVISSHYCMDKIQSVQLGVAESKKCTKCGMEKHGGCCRDEVKVVKLQQEPLVAKLMMPQQNSITVTTLIPEHFTASFYNFRNDKDFNLWPPLISHQYTYLSICVFRI